MQNVHIDNSVTSVLHPNMTRLVLYGMTGAVGTAGHFFILFTTTPLFGPVLASTFGAVTGCIVNYILARQLVFESTASCTRSFPRFVGVATLGVALNGALIATFVDTLPLALNQAVASGAVLLLGFILNNRWTFNECPAGQ